MPLVSPAADGFVGDFGLDTGNAGPAIFFGQYLRAHRFSRRYPPGEPLIGHGTGGANSGSRQTLRSLRIGGRTLHELPALFTQMRSGSFSSWTEAGNLGYVVLSHFVPTFDYRRRILYLETNPRARPLPVNRWGLRVSKKSPAAFDVDTVASHSAAASAGIEPGDRIVAINGSAAETLSRADFVTLSERPVGTALRLRVEHRGRLRDVVLILRT
jgi:membrane-associated protease RseP (regulator of RpoE activity)